MTTELVMDEVYTLQEAAVRLKVDPRVLSKAIKEGESNGCPYTHTHLSDKTIRISVQQFNDFLANKWEHRTCTHQWHENQVKTMPIRRVL